MEQELAQIRAQERKAVDTWLTAQAHRQETRRREKQVRPAMVRFQARCRGVLVRLEMREEMEMERASREAAVVPLQMAYRKYRRSCIVGPYHTLDSIAAALTNDDAAAPQICDALSPIGITRGRGHERKTHADVALLQRCWRGAATRFAFRKALPKLQEERRLRQLGAHLIHDAAVTAKGGSSSRRPRAALETPPPFSALVIE